MLIKPITPLLKENKNPTTMSYLGTVEDNDDPEKLGRLRVRISPYTDFLTDELPWASPILGSCGNSSSAGGLNIPEIGSQVRVTFPSQDFSAPYYTGAELNSLNRTTFFDDDYPNVYGYKDSNGNFIKINKKSGVTNIRHESGTNMEVKADGSIVVTLRNGASFSFSSHNTFEINTEALEITGNGAVGSLEISAASDVEINTRSFKVNSSSVAITGDISSNTGASGVLWLLNGIATVKDGRIVSIKNTVG